ncbi:MAG: MFS transporter [Puniceicoccaceae bacterium]|nr:MAG: MFS transporter [Puniceicoccaceae bacterium]
MSRIESKNFWTDPVMSTTPSTRSNLKYCTADGFFAMPWILLSLPGSFIAASLLNSLFQIGPFWFGVVTAMPAVANAIHILILPFFAKFMLVRDMAISFGWLNLGAWFGGALGIAFLPLDQPDQAGLFFAILYGTISITSSLMGIAWTAWVGDFVPAQLRGRYFGKRNRLTSVSTIAFMLLSIALLQFFDASRQAYLILISVALFGRMISMMILHLIQSPDPSGGAISQANWARELTDLRQQKALLRFIVFGSVAGFWLAGAGAIAALYAFNDLGASPAQFTQFALVATLSGAICLPLWGKLIDRHGAIPIIMITFFGWRAGDIGWVLITPDSLHWMYLIWLSGGAMATGYILASFTVVLKLIPRKSRSAGISLNLTSTSIAGAAAPLIVGTVLSKVGDYGISTTLAYRSGMAACIIGGLLSVLILYRMREPETDPHLNTINGAMRTLRQLVVNQGVSFFSNTVLVRRNKRRR